VDSNLCWVPEKRALAMDMLRIMRIMERKMRKCQACSIQGSHRGSNSVLAGLGGLVFRLNQTVARVPASAVLLNENAPLKQDSYIPQRRVAGTLGELGIL
jgi:hypothetical protein